VKTKALAPDDFTVLPTEYTCKQDSAVTNQITVLQNHFGCDSVVVRTVIYRGFEFQSDFENLTCFENQSGWIDLLVFSPGSVVSFNWSNGSTQEDQSDLSAGDYTVTITNNFGCSMGQSFTLTQPEQLTVSFDTVSVTCFQNDGKINLTVTGGTIPYQYNWNTSVNTQNLSNLAPGNYAVTVTDLNGCAAEAEITLASPYCPPTDDCEAKVFHDGTRNPVRIIVSDIGQPEKIRYEVFSNLGLKVQSGDLTQNDEISVANLASGVYFVHIYASVEVGGERKPQILRDKDGNYSWKIRVPE
jgi:hypothetical protein